jgi:hypothetical protein
MTKAPTLDSLAKGFLGVASEKETRVIKGQTANAARQQAFYEQQLLHEACEFGDILVHYVGSHVDLPLPQRAFGTALGILNLRRDYPTGGEQFDELADLGGEELQLPKSTKPAPIIEPPLPLTGEALHNAAAFAESFVRYVTMKKQQLGLSNPQAAYGLGRAFHNLRLTFPVDDGNTVAFDFYAQQAGEYFNHG